MPADAPRAAAVALAAALASGPAPAQEAPRSAIPWLAEAVEAATRGAAPDAEGIDEESIAVSPIGAQRADGAGLLPASASGLPRDAVAGSDPQALADEIAALPVGGPPAMQALVQRILLAELDPPRGVGGAASVLLPARIDALVARGALDRAQALVEAAGTEDGAVFARWADVALLSGEDDALCEAARGRADTALALRAFCLARGDDWPAAALTLETGLAIGAIDAGQGERLARFLDPELYEDMPPPAAPRPMTPLDFRLLDGIGETPPTRGLGLAYAASDLRPTLGWKRRIEAAEQLARAGALDPNRLLALYTDARPSASGGVWDRAAAVQALDATLAGDDACGIGAALPTAIEAMAPAGLVPVLAALYGARAAARAAGCDAAAFERAVEGAQLLALLSGEAAAAAALPRPADPRLAMARDLLSGADPTVPPDDALAAAVARGLAAQDGDDRLDRLAGEGRLAEALLAAVELLSEGGGGDPAAVARGLGVLVRAGFEDVARRATVELLLL